MENHSCSSRSYARVSSSIATSVPRAFERPADVLDDPSSEQLPRHHDLGVILALELDPDRPDGTLLTVPDVVEPLVEVERADDPAPERDVGVPGQAGELPDLIRPVIAVAILDDVDGHADLAALLEPGLRPVRRAGAEVDEEVELSVGKVAKNGHLTLLGFACRIPARRGRRELAPRTPADGCSERPRPASRSSPPPPLLDDRARNLRAIRPRGTGRTAPPYVRT